MNAKHRFVLFNLLSFEFILLNLVLVGFLYFSLSDFSLLDPFFRARLFELMLIYNISWLLIILYIRDNAFYFNPRYNYIRSFVISVFCFVGIVITLIVALKIRYFARSIYIIPIFIFSYLNLVSQKYILKFLKNRASHLFSDTLLITGELRNSKLNRFVKAMSQYGYNIIGSLQHESPEAADEEDVKVIGSIGELKHVLSTYEIDEIFIDMSDLSRNEVSDSIAIADDFGVRVKLIPDNPLYMSRNYKAATVGELAVFKLRQNPLDNFNTTIVKRIFDFCFALVTLIVFSPVYLIIALLIYMESGGPVFYTPLRKGEGGKTFKCYKFRTMSTCDNPMNGTKSTTVNDPRITKVGRILRKNDLDELPQFINVLKGEMSVIGPRPHRIHLQNSLRKSVSNYMVRSYVKPGITGWAQVNGWRGPTITDQEKNERINHDLWYIENWSFWLDIKIIFLTLFGRHRKNAF